MAPKGLLGHGHPVVYWRTCPEMLLDAALRPLLANRLLYLCCWQQRRVGLASPV